ncbi:hypothetical protein XM38_036230 [Halomicronema hongdechloris C2206]|uniref:Uncharacterized protein n=1 Tax=Halomicronema hongdechloris C2206 TaxID=1641165 RepID=A0A1Z3HQU9_9CYAN|nr:DUF5752 family protein [Halomicronema hongdechloris]ASC72665.1 hypothetical protein XM38_036230 [Halomicronema hongdechloris C2206]
MDSSDANMDAFALKDCALISIATGKKAESLKELRSCLLTISLDSIYLHFWGGLLKSRFEEREFNNDFAAWCRHSLHDHPLAERLAVLDPQDYGDLEALRQEMLSIVEERLDESEYLHWVLASDPFEFLRSQIVVFDTYQRIQRPEELTTLLPHLSTSSLFYHFIDARRRLPEGIDDFRYWLAGFDGQYQPLADELAGVDPYFESLTALRQQVTTIFETCCPGNTP